MVNSNLTVLNVTVSVSLVGMPGMYLYWACHVFQLNLVSHSVAYRQALGSLFVARLMLVHFLFALIQMLPVACCFVLCF